MHRQVLDVPGKVTWIDIIQPEKLELDSIAAKYGLHPTSLVDCLDPLHLPKSERIGEVTFVITRAYDDRCSSEGDTVQELTRKVALFLGRDFLITVHRADLEFIAELRTRFGNDPQSLGGVSTIAWEILRSAVKTFEVPIERVHKDLEQLETDIFTHRESEHRIVKEMYFLKRKSSVFKRVLRLTHDALEHFKSNSDMEAPLLQDVKETTQRLQFYGDELLENANSLLNHYLSLSTHRTNEIIRVLTVFSAFFLPLTFLVGVYGMNFENMPEIRWKYGYPFSIAIMIGISLSIFIWFKRKKWID